MPINITDNKECFIGWGDFVPGCRLRAVILSGEVMSKEHFVCLPQFIVYCPDSTV